MRFGNPVRQRLPRATRNPAVRAKRIRASQRKPPPQVADVAESIEQRLFVIPQKRNQPATTGKSNESINDSAAVRTPVDVVAQRDQRILRPRIDCIDERSQSSQTAVDVTDRNRAARHALLPMATKTVAGRLLPGEAFPRQTVDCAEAHINLLVLLFPHELVAR